jgi:SSS family solute:Na+ symporter
VFGLWARQLFPGIDAEQSLFTLMKDILPSGLLGIGFAGILAAAMSSIDSLIVVGSTSFTNDIYARYFHKHGNEHHLLNRTRLFSVIFGGVALIVAYFIPNIVELIVFSTFLTINFIPMILGGFFWDRANAKAALWAMILSTIVLVVSWITIGVNAWAPALLTSILIFVVGSIFSKPRFSLVSRKY